MIILEKIVLGEIMKHEIDLNNYNIRTDLVLEQVGKVENNSNIKKEVRGEVSITTIRVDLELSRELDKQEGMYVTLEFEDITDIDSREQVGRELEGQIKMLLELNKITDDASCLVVGLGNRNSTADSLGPKTIDKVLVTRHLFIIDQVKEGIRNVSVLNPGVMASTGMETFDIIKGIIGQIHPDFIIVVDALAASSIERVNKTIQITDTGIHPGSGIGNHRVEVSKRTLGIPVLALGIPTVVESSVIVSDTITYLFKHLSYLMEHQNLNKLVVTRNNYLKKIREKELSLKEKQELFGMIGGLEEEEKNGLIQDVLNSIDYNLIVTPKEIDFVIDKLSEVIGNSLNNALHRQITHF